MAATDSPPLATNRRANFNYEILETFEAGMVLRGSEIKSVRDRKISIAEAYVQVRDNEAWLHNAHIAPYYAAGVYGQHDKMAASDAYPTSDWKKGTVIRDKFEILISPDTPPGRYTIEVGLYTTYRGIERLPLKSGGDRVLLAQVEVDR